MKIVKYLYRALLVFVALAVLAYAGMNIFFSVKAPKSPVVDDADIKLVEDEVPLRQNAYIAFLAVTNMLDYTQIDRLNLEGYRDKRLEQANAFFKLKGTTIDRDRVRVDKILADREDWFIAMHKLASLPKYRSLIEPLPSIDFVDMVNRANTLLWVKTIRCSEKGEYENALEALRDCIKYSKLCRDNASSLSEMIMGDNHYTMSILLLSMLGNMDEIPDNLLEEIAAEFGETATEPVEFNERTLKCEYVNATFSSLQLLDMALKTDNALKMAPLVTRSRLAMMLKNNLPNWDWQKRLINNFAYNREMTQLEIINIYRTFLKDLSVDPVTKRPSGIFEPNWAGQEVCTRVCRAITDVRSELTTNLLKRRFAQVSVAVHRYRRANDGEYPLNLEALVPTYIKELPRDPSDPEKALDCNVQTIQIWSVGKKRKSR